MENNIKCMMLDFYFVKSHKKTSERLNKFYKKKEKFFFLYFQRIYFFSGLTVPIIPQAKRFPALPVFFDSSSPPRPKSSGFS